MTKISEKGIEKAARAMCAAEGHKDPDVLICPAFDHHNPRPRWTFYADDARAAITAYLVVVEAERFAALEGDHEAHAGVPSDDPLSIQERDRLIANGVTPASDPRYPQALAEAEARAKGENLDGSPRRECSLAEVGITASDPTPAGWRMVQVEPTQEMTRAAMWALDRQREKDGLIQHPRAYTAARKHEIRWKAMLDAAPEPPVSDGMTQAARDVLAERQLQIAKGWTPEHDDGHDNAELITSSWGAIERLKQADSLIGFSGPRRQKARERLVEAAAQVIAEIERLDRLPAAPKGKESE